MSRRKSSRREEESKSVGGKGGREGRSGGEGSMEGNTESAKERERE